MKKISVIWFGRQTFEDVWCRFSGLLCVSAVILLAASFSIAADLGPVQSEQDKAKVLRDVAQNWIRVGISQSQRGFYQQAEKSFLIARGYQEYLTAQEHKELEEYLTKAHNDAIEKQAVLEQINKARDLLRQGQPIKARAYYEKARSSPYLTEEESRQITRELDSVDGSFDAQRKEITELYNRSVEFYRAGELEKAREGFLEVARYGLLVAPDGHSAEDYLIQIDSILTERFKKGLKVESGPTAELPVSASTVPGDSELELLGPDSERQTYNQQNKIESKQQPKDVQEEAAELAAIAEPLPDRLADTESTGGKKIKIICTYTKAVIDDAESKSMYYVSRGELENAVASVRTATYVIKENRSFIGDALFLQYSIRLKQLADRIIQAQKDF